VPRDGKTASVSHAYRVDDGQSFHLKDFDPADTGAMPTNEHAAADLAKGVEQLRDLQTRLYAQGQWALLVILQGLDASGKDSVIKHVMSGLNPQGCQVSSFKAPSAEELAHDFLWREQRVLPERGRIGIFNRSYYEEVLVVRVHPELLANKHIPARLLKGDVWKQRFADIRAYEEYLAHNGIAVRKFFLNLSKREQRKRFLERLNRPDKNWKFDPNDVREREYWDDYMHAYEEMVRQTSTPDAPWYVVPADKKWFTRLVVADAVAEALEELGVDYPKFDAAKRKQMEEARAILEAEDG
jgi:PPK2 family polyphosphate:nucleotide phosphotransferase